MCYYTLVRFLTTNKHTLNPYNTRMNWTLYRWDCPTKHQARPKPTEKTRSEIHACTSPFHVHSVSKRGWDFECFQISEEQVGRAGPLHGQWVNNPARWNSGNSPFAMPRPCAIIGPDDSKKLLPSGTHWPIPTMRQGVPQVGRIDLGILRP